MSAPSSDQTMLSKLRRRICSVGAATAALLAQYTVAEAAGPAHRSTNTVPAVARTADKKSVSRPLIAPLVLTPGNGATVTPIGGHRSHSSHRSHTSASYRSHSSHFSGAITVPRVTLPRTRASTTPKSSAGSTRTPPTEQPLVEAPEAEMEEQETPPEQGQAEAEPAEKPAPEPEIDYSDPLKRFKLVSVSGAGAITRAAIEDFKTGEVKRMKEGEVFAGYKLTKINVVQKSVEIRTDEKDRSKMKNIKPVTLVWRK